MKSQILLGAGLCLLSYISQAQSKLIFNYDLAGNQIKYRYCKGADCDRQRASKTKDSITKKPETLDDFVVNRGTEFRVFPNPASHILYTDWYLKDNPKLTNVEVSDISGKTLKLEFIEVDNGTEISLSDLSNGVYFIRFYFDDYTQFTRKILKN